MRPVYTHRLCCVMALYKMSERTIARQVLLFVCFFSFSSVRGQVSYTIPEEMPKGSLVGNIAQDLGLDVKRLKSGKARVFSGDTAEYIELNKERGVLLIKERIDRETLCKQTSPCALHLQIILETPIELYRITIEVTDINDNAPRFKRTEKRFEISESAVVGSKFMLEKAVDEDIGKNGLQRYILSPTDSFTLKLGNQADEGKTVEMILQKPLDREKQENMSLLLTAIDGGEPEMSGTVQIHITVLDVNDNAPVFTKSLYKAVITENALKGTSILSVSAFDQDKGSNGDVTYSISSNIDRISEMFHVDEKGVVTLVGDIDYEKAKYYQIDVEATDNGGLSDSSKIMLDVIDVNDNKPLITSMSKSSKGSRFSLDSAHDPDVGQNTLQRYTLNPSNHFTLKELSRSDGTKYVEMVLQTPLDREQQEEHTLILTAFDGGTPQKSGTVKITVVVIDANDNPPMFSQSVYRVFLPENAEQGSSVVRVSATDKDKGSYGEVSYSFSQNTGKAMEYFTINSATGEIRVNVLLDYEKSKQYELNVEAMDKGRLTDTSKVLVEITDVNDNAPVISVISFSNPIAEDSAPETVIAMLNVKDIDSGKNGQIRCSVDSDLPFRIKSSSSNFYSLVTDQFLDREKNSEYNITITATDEGSPSFSTNKTLNLKICDVNDNAPVFQRQSYTAYVLENNTPGVSIFAMTAADQDSGNNARVSYFLEDVIVNGVSASTYISVNAESGEILALRSSPKKVVFNYIC
uniref:Protocadherin 2 gamma 28 n=1 Tax=Astyanax mexicanus TaxID=7994 RepID=A0A8B9J4A8_ASTMX